MVRAELRHGRRAQKYNTGTADDRRVPYTIARVSCMSHAVQYSCYGTRRSSALPVLYTLSYTFERVSKLESVSTRLSSLNILIYLYYSRFAAICKNCPRRGRAADVARRHTASGVQHTASGTQQYTARRPEATSPWQTGGGRTRARHRPSALPGRPAPAEQARRARLLRERCDSQQR